MPQSPHRAPWFVVCGLVACLAFLVGHFFSSTNPSGSDNVSGVTDALHAQANEPDVSKATMRHASVNPPAPSLNPVADIVSSAEPAVVSIDTIIREDSTPSSSVSIPDLLFSKPKSLAHQDSDTYEAHGAGSGILVRSDGYVLTNFHVVKGASDIKITLNDGRRYSGKVVGHDGYTDVALVKIDADHLPVAKLGSSKTVRPGDWAIAIGSPLGLNRTVTMGIVSAVGRSLADLNNNVDLIQTDAAINPGNSGGPLLNIRGEVVGINMAIRTDAQNIGFSIPIDTAREAATSILDGRPIARPYLGVSMVDFDPQLASSVGLPNNQQGVLVSKVNSSGPAARSGISEGDLIETVDNAQVRSGSDVQRVVRAHKIGNRLRLEIFRAGKRKVVTVTLRAFPQGKDDG